jgi:hypothetical protein
LVNIQNILNVCGQDDDFIFLTHYESGGGFTEGVNLKMGGARGTPSAPLALQNGDYIAEIEAFVFNGVDFQETAEIKFFVDGAVANGQNSPSRIEFWTNVLNAPPLVRVTITSQGLLLTQAVSATISGFRLPHGTAPSSPVNGDLWTTSAGGLFGRINGVTQNYAPLASPTFTGTVSAAALTMTGTLIVNNANAQILNSGTANNTVLSSAGTVGSGSGAYFRLYGQTAAGTPGDIDLVMGSSGNLRAYSAGVASFSVSNLGLTTLCANINTTAGGSVNGVKFGSSGITGIFTGSGAPTVSAPKGALYLRTDGSGINDRAYINTNGGTTWTALVTVA